MVDTYVYRLGINSMKYSYSSAVSLFQNMISVVLVFVVNQIVKKIDQEGIV